LLGFSSARGEGDWGTIKGRVVLEGKLPDPIKLAVDADPKECLKNGALFNQELVVDSKTKGVRWAVVFLISEDATLKESILKVARINPDAEPKEKDVFIDQPCCQFEPRVVCIRAGKQALTVKNPAPMTHNILILGGPDINQAIPAKTDLPVPFDWKGTRNPIKFACTIHKWMNGHIWVFAHPYYAVTNEKGEFEIRGAPKGKCRLVVWQEAVGFVVGDKENERLGMPIKILPDKINDLGELKLKLPPPAPKP
jgi:hypothetical protein